jgi:hypothetical protein
MTAALEISEQDSVHLIEKQPVLAATSATKLLAVRTPSKLPLIKK